MVFKVRKILIYNFKLKRNKQSSLRLKCVLICCCGILVSFVKNMSSCQILSSKFVWFYNWLLFNCSLKCVCWPPYWSSDSATGSSTDKLVEDREALFKRRVLLKMTLDNTMDTLLDHYVDQIFFIALKNDSKKKKTGGLSVSHWACHEQIHLFTD